MHRAIRQFGHRFGGMAEDAVERLGGDGIFDVVDSLSLMLAVVKFPGVESRGIMTGATGGAERGGFGGFTF